MERDEHPFAEAAHKLSHEFPSAPLDNVIAAIHQASAEQPADGSDRVLERARIILRAGRERMN